MAWIVDSSKILAVILNDFGAATYTPSRLYDLLIASAYLVNNQINFDTTYTVSVSNCTITPDPSDIFINFMVLRAACLADQGLFRQKALLAGIEARCGPAQLKTVHHIQGFGTLLREGPCKAYEEMVDEFRFNGNTKAIRAILSPFVGNQFNPDVIHGRHSLRDRVDI